ESVCGPSESQNSCTIRRALEGKHMRRPLFSLLILFGASTHWASGADPLPEPVPAGARLGDKVSETFVNGPDAGKKRSLSCTLAGRPAVLIYAREIVPTLTNLLKKLDAVARRDSEQKMKSSCVLLTVKDEDQEQIQALARREKLEATLLVTTSVQ